jgi:hypothetical protein
VDDPKRQAARDILTYFLKHPEAQDTAEGIAEWWILEQEIQRRLDEVQQALQSLTEEGLLLSRRPAEAKTLYGVNPERLSDIQRFLSEDA